LDALKVKKSLTVRTDRADPQRMLDAGRVGGEGVRLTLVPYRSIMYIFHS
jgi:hypothetical protein